MGRSHPLCKASIVIRTLNEAAYLDDLLAMVNRQQTDNIEIETVVIDSGSADATIKIAQAQGARVTHISKTEFSFGRSLNKGCAFSTGDILVFISGHCVPVDENWLQRLCQPLIDGKAVYSYGRQIADDTSNFSERRIFAKYFPEMSAIPQQGFFCNNANAALLRSVWDHNQFDEELTGLEDMELAKRLVSQDMAIAYAADATVFHHHSESWKQVRRRFEREAIALQKIMPEVHLSRWDVVKCITHAVLGDFRNARLHENKSTSLADMIRYRFNQYVGSYIGNHDHRLVSRQKMQDFFYPHKDEKAQQDDWLKPHRRPSSHESQ